MKKITLPKGTEINIGDHVRFRSNDTIRKSGVVKDFSAEGHQMLIQHEEREEWVAVNIQIMILGEENILIYSN